MTGRMAKVLAFAESEGDKQAAKSNHCICSQVVKNAMREHRAVLGQREFPELLLRQAQFARPLRS